MVVMKLEAGLTLTSKEVMWLLFSLVREDMLYTNETMHRFTTDQSEGYRTFTAFHHQHNALHVESHPRLGCIFRIFENVLHTKGLLRLIFGPGLRLDGMKNGMLQQTCRTRTWNYCPNSMVYSAYVQKECHLNHLSIQTPNQAFPVE